MKKISVILATLNRNQHLLQCINSLIVQTRAPDEILVIDNSSDGNARTVIDDLRRAFGPLRYFNERKRGISYAKNLGIRKAKHEVLAFIDDDCIADSNWIDAILKSYTKGVDSVMGSNLNGNSNNLYSCLEYYHTQRSIAARLHKQRGTVLSQLVDPKNFSIRKTVLIKNRVLFDETFGGYAGLEEVEFSKRLEEKHIAVIYKPQMRVSHHGRTSFLTHTIREYKAGRALYFFYTKRMDEINRDIEQEKKKQKIQGERTHNEIRKLRESILNGKGLLFRILFRILDGYSLWIKRVGYIVEKRAYNSPKIRTGQ